MIFLNLAKAFDVVEYDIFIMTLRRLGVTALNRFKSCPLDQQQRT